MLELVNEIHEKLVELDDFEHPYYLLCWHISKDEEPHLSVWAKHDNTNIDIHNDSMKFKVEGNKLNLVSEGIYSLTDVNNVVEYVENTEPAKV